MDNPAAPIPPISPQPTAASLPVEALSKAGPAESSGRRWFLWLAGGLAILIFGIAIDIFSARHLNQPSTQPPGNFFPTSKSVIPTSNPDAKEPEKCLTVVGSCVLKGCDYNPKQCAASLENTCSIDQDCGLNICDCLALPKGAIAEKDKICARYCPGTPRCINSRCQVVTENN